MPFYPGEDTWRRSKLEEALAAAERGLPVFRLRPGTKEPFYGSRGFYDATTDPEAIRRWWRQSPDANIGVPTGEASGLLVVDVDHQSGLEALQAEHGKLPATRAHITGSGGTHYLYRYPAGSGIRNSAGALAEHIDVRGEGGYIVAPGSWTTGPYELLDERPVAAAPGWLLGELEKRGGGRPGASPGGNVRTGAGCTRSVGSPRGATISADPSIAGPPIPEGTRDDALARIAGRLHDGSRDLDGLTRDLMGINAARCVPPLPDGQVEKVARSIHARTPCEKGPTASDEALVALADIEDGFLKKRSWAGKGGKSERSVYVAAIEEARRHGTLIPGGVRFSYGARPWALAAGVGKRGLFDQRRDGEMRPGAISRLKRRGLLRSDGGPRRDGETGAYVLVVPQERWSAVRANAHHSTNQPGGGVVHISAPPLRWGVSSRSTGLRGTVRDTRRVRSSAPESSRMGVRRMGKGCEGAIYFLRAAGGTLDIEDLYGLINPHKDREDRKRWRPRDLRRREIARLVAAGVVESSGGKVSLTHDWLGALNFEREIAGEIAAHKRDMKRYQRERDAYREHLEDRKRGARGWDHHPANARADGWVGELRPEGTEAPGQASPEAPVSGLAAALRGYLEKNPTDAYQRPSWLGVTLWALDLVTDKPAAADVGSAIEELGGDPYLRLLLGRAREAGVA